jgi:hypothetical protein
MADDDFPMMLDMESEDRFLDLYAHLLVYVNDRFDVVEDVETVDDSELSRASDRLAARVYLRYRAQISVYGRDATWRFYSDHRPARHPRTAALDVRRVWGRDVRRDPLDGGLRRPG